MKADYVFRNGQVVTVNAQNEVAEAVAVKENRIVAVGSNGQIDEYIGSGTEVIDLKGNSLLPGFIDSHFHLTIRALTKVTIDCYHSPDIRSIGDLIEALRARARVTPPGQWIVATNYFESKMAEKRFPTRWELDQASTEHPIFVMRMDIHNSFVNSKALELAGIDEHTPDPAGGHYMRDEGGVPNGILVENAHFKMMDLTRPSDEVLLKGLAAVSRELVEFGITSVHDAGGYGADDIRLMQQASRSGIFKSRIWAFLLSLYNPRQYIETAIRAGMVTGMGDEKFRLGPVKIFVDGGSGGPNIAVRQPYTHNPNDYGTLFYTQEEINDIFIPAHAKGFQITAHANGDRAIEMMLNMFELALEKYPRPHRHRLEHAGLTQPDLLERMKKLGIVIAPNPGFYKYLGDLYEKFYAPRIMHPIKSWIDAGLKPMAGSDSPCVPEFHPMLGIWGAVTRISGSGKVYGPEQRISLMDAIRLYTWNGAHASFEEDIKGSIEPGKLADLVALNGRILDVDANDLKDMNVELTMIDGELLYKK